MADAEQQQQPKPRRKKKKKQLPALTDAVREKLVELFAVLDKDNSGQLDAEEFLILAKAMGVENATEEDARAQIRRADKDNNEELDLEEWLNFSRILMVRGEASALRTVEVLTKKSRKMTGADEDGAAAGGGANA